MPSLDCPKSEDLWLSETQKNGQISVALVSVDFNMARVLENQNKLKQLYQRNDKAVFKLTGQGWKVIQNINRYKNQVLGIPGV